MKESEREEGASLSIHAQEGGEVASEGSIEEPCGVALLPMVGHSAIAFTDLKGVSNTTANIPLTPAFHPSISFKPVSFGTIHSNQSCRATRYLQLCLKCQSLIQSSWRDTRGTRKLKTQF